MTTPSALVQELWNYCNDLRDDRLSRGDYAGEKWIAVVMERPLSVVEGLSALVETNLQRAARLRQVISQRAFEGRLVC